MNKTIEEEILALPDDAGVAFIQIKSNAEWLIFGLRSDVSDLKLLATANRKMREAIEDAINTIESIPYGDLHWEEKEMKNNTLHQLQKTLALAEAIRDK